MTVVRVSLLMGLTTGLTGLVGIGFGIMVQSASAHAAGACLSMPLAFETETAQGCPDAATIERLMDAPLPIGSQSPETGKPEGVELTSPDDETARKFVRSCRVYSEAVQQGWYAATQMQMNLEGFMRVACGSLLALEASQKAISSRFDAEAVSFQTLSLLPVDVLPALSPDTEEALALLKKGNFSVGMMVATGDVLTRSGNPDQLELAYAGVASTYGEVARGDFNGDGAEDLLVYARNEAVNGSLRWYDLFALSYPEQSLTFERFEPATLAQLNPKN